MKSSLCHFRIWTFYYEVQIQLYLGPNINYLEQCIIIYLAYHLFTLLMLTQFNTISLVNYNYHLIDLCLHLSSLYKINL